MKDRLLYYKEYYETHKVKISTYYKEYHKEKKRKYERKGHQEDKPKGEKVVLSPTEKMHQRLKDGLCARCGKPRMQNSNRYCRTCWFVMCAHDSLKNGSRDAGRFLEDLLERQNYRCPYTGRLLIPGINCQNDHKYPRKRFPNLVKDRGNVQWVHAIVNSAKHDMTHEEFLEYIFLVAENQKSRVHDLAYRHLSHDGDYSI